MLLPSSVTEIPAMFSLTYPLHLGKAIWGLARPKTRGTAPPRAALGRKTRGTRHAHEGDGTAAPLGRGAPWNRGAAPVMTACDSGARRARCAPARAGWAGGVGAKRRSSRSGRPDVQAGTAAQTGARPGARAGDRASGLPGGLLDTQVVLDVGDAGHAFRQVLSVALLEAGAHGPGERHLPVLHGDVDLRGIDVRIVREAVID